MSLVEDSRLFKGLVVISAVAKAGNISLEVIAVVFVAPIETVLRFGDL